jgi:hypothetical protein
VVKEPCCTILYLMHLVTCWDRVLCGCRNVNIVPTEDDAQPFQLQLLSTDMLHEQMGEHLADAGGGGGAPAAAAEAGDKGKAGNKKGSKGGGRKGGAKGSQQPLQALDNLLGGGDGEDGGEEECVPVKQPAAKRAKTGGRRAAAA